MLPRTPVLAMLFAMIIAILIVLIFEIPGRPFTIRLAIWLYTLSLLPGLGIAMLFDPAPRAAKERFLKINFYEEKKS
ncbi:MAG: hypothetical protein Kow00102_15400 [Spirochaetota bacterium]